MIFITQLLKTKHKLYIDTASALQPPPQPLWNIIFWGLHNVKFHLKRKLQTEHLYFVLASTIIYFCGSDEWKKFNGWKTGNIVGQTCSWLFWISSLTSISTPRLTTKIKTRKLPTTNKHATTQPRHPVLHSVSVCLDHTLHRLCVWITYAVCCLERQSTPPWNRTSGLDPSIRTGIYIISLKVTDHTHKENIYLCSTPWDDFSCKYKDGVYCQRTCL